MALGNSKEFPTNTLLSLKQWPLSHAKGLERDTSVTSVKETLCVGLTVGAHFKALQILPSSSFLARAYARPVSEGQTEVPGHISVHWANDSLISFLGVFHLMSRVSLSRLGWP